MRDRRALARLFALLMALSLIAAACGGDDDDSSSGGGSSTTEAQGKPEPGGTLVVGAEQELDCADWISSCAGASWGTWIFGGLTMARAHDYDPKSGDLVASPVLAKDAQLDDADGPGMKVTYTIADDAVWSDGQPITSTDFKFTWDAVKNGTDIYDKSGYKDISAVDDSDPKVAVVTFDKDYAAWKELFGGFFGIYPSHILQGKDHNAEMKDGYKWSGGPWMLDHWTKGQELVLVPNPKYFGQKPYLDKVVFKFIPETAAEVEAYKSGQAAAIYPQAQLELEPLRSAPDTEFSAGKTLSYEALWLNTTKAPLDDVHVRKALAYATDRKAIVDALFKPVDPDIQPIQAISTPANVKWYSDPFKSYTRDLDKVTEEMEGGGWKKGSDGIWAKAGKKATLELNSTAGNARRQRTGEILQSQWKEAGFELKLNFTQAGTIFGEWLPQGNFFIGLYAQSPASTDPSICGIFCSENIPTAASPSGQNYTRLNSKALDDAWHAVETTLDEGKRKQLVDEGQQAIADEVPAIPIDPLPNILVYNTAKIHGAGGSNVVYGPFAGLNEWWCTGGAC
ncbi:MAG: peptide/nickel transport system substrate-binding protein [Actinomycetota bacterium]|nr:peptide/nickel transport system substrate-binding protein [Actinomycetota bacterium]